MKELRVLIVEDDPMVADINRKFTEAVIGFVVAGTARNGQEALLLLEKEKPDLLPFVCDAATSKQGKFMPGSRIPIRPPAALAENPPDYLLVLPWNIVEEVRQQNAHLAKLGTRFVTAVPEMKIL